MPAPTLTPTHMRRLVSRDEAHLDAFLAQSPDTTLLLRANLASAGLGDHEGQVPLAGIYVGAFEAGGELRGVVAHYRNGNLVLAAEGNVAPLAREVVALSLRPVLGLLGPWAEIIKATRALELTERPTRIASRQPLYALDLADLLVPEPLRASLLTVRVPHVEELAQLLDWRLDYAAETSALVDSPEARALEGARLGRYQRDGHCFVATRDDQLVAYSAFNAALPGIVQVGGVFTPPPFRGRGYGRAVVAGSLLHARERGVRRAVLCTDEANFAARRSYEALGFLRYGEYGIVLFA